MSSVAIQQKRSHRQLACPGCKKTYLIPAALNGKVAECKHCGTRMQIGHAKPTKAHGKVPTLPGIRTAGTGILLSACGGVLLMITALLVVLLAVLHINIGPDTARVLLIGGAATSGLLSLSGLIMQFAMPRQSGAKGWLIGSVMMVVVALSLFAWAAICVATGSRFPVPALISNSIILLLGTASFVCYMVFLGKTSSFVGRPELSGTAKGLVWYHLLGPVLLSIILLGLPLMVKASSGTVLIYNSLMIAVQIATLISNVIAVVLMCQIGTHIRRGTR